MKPPPSVGLSPANRNARRVFARHVGRMVRTSQQLQQHAPFMAAPPPPSSGEGWFGQIDRAWTNGWYAVLGRPVQTAWGEVLHLAVRDLPNGRLLWHELQWIKDRIVGFDRVAVEVYPAAVDLVDDANMFHLWVLPAGFNLPFNLKEHSTEPPNDPAPH